MGGTGVVVVDAHFEIHLVVQVAIFFGAVGARFVGLMVTLVLLILFLLSLIHLRTAALDDLRSQALASPTLLTLLLDLLSLTRHLRWTPLLRMPLPSSRTMGAFFGILSVLRRLGRAIWLLLASHLVILSDLVGGSCVVTFCFILLLLGVIFHHHLHLVVLAFFKERLLSFFAFVVVGEPTPLLLLLLLHCSYSLPLLQLLLHLHLADDLLILKVLLVGYTDSGIITLCLLSNKCRILHLLAGRAAAFSVPLLLVASVSLLSC